MTAPKLPAEPKVSNKDWETAKPWELEPYYSMWVGALTTQNLHHKSDIATVLAIYEDKLDVALTKLTSALARVADMEGEIELINGQLRYVMKSNEANFNRAEAANARAEAAEKDAKQLREVLIYLEISTRPDGQWEFAAGNHFVKAALGAAAIDAMVTS